MIHFLSEKFGEDERDGGLVRPHAEADVSGHRSPTFLDTGLLDRHDAERIRGTRQPGSDHGVSDEGFSVVEAEAALTLLERQMGAWGIPECFKHLR